MFVSSNVSLNILKNKLDQGLFIMSDMEPVAFESTQIYILDKPGAAQSVLVVGNLGLERNNPDYITCQVINNALGGMFTSRLNTNLREEKAYFFDHNMLFVISHN